MKQAEAEKLVMDFEKLGEAQELLRQQNNAASAEAQRKRDAAQLEKEMAANRVVWKAVDECIGIVEQAHEKVGPMWDRILGSANRVHPPSAQATFAGLHGVRAEMDRDLRRLQERRQEI